MKKLLFFASLLIGCFKAGYTQPGSVDTSFGNKGIVATDFGLLDTHYYITDKNLLLDSSSNMYLTLSGIGFTCIAKRLPNGAADLKYGKNGFSDPVALKGATAALDTGGKIILVGASSSFYGTPMVIKYNKDGTVENKFPVAIYDFEPSSLAIQNDGKIVVVGYDFQTRYTIVRYNSDGTFDNTFSQDGQAISDFRSISTISLQPDNKLVIAGQYGSVYNQPGSDFAVARYKTDGSMDSSFGSGGKQTTTFGFGSVATSLALKNDGKIVAAGYSYNNYNNNVEFILTCYNTDGSLDSTFSNDGKMIVSSSVSSIATQKNGKIVTVGSAADNFELIRYNRNGTLDNTFNGNGKQITDFGSSDIAQAVAIQSDGKIVAAGNGTGNNYDQGNFFEVARYNSSGSPDNTFDNDGKLKESLHFNQGSTYYTTTKVQSDGKAVAAGYTSNGTDYDFAIARYNTDGSLDKSFSIDGRQTTGFGSGNDYASSMAIQKDGKIVVVGFANGHFAIVRYNTDGSPDNTFIGNAKPKTDLGPAVSVAIQSNGKIVVACSGFTIVRYNTNGSLDSSFAHNGMLTTYFGGVNTIHEIALQSDGKIVAVGVSVFYYEKTDPDFYSAVARYNADGSLDNTFSEDGKLLSPADEADAYNSVAIQGDNKIITGQHSNGFIYLTRYNFDGSYDNTFGNNGTASHSASYGRSSRKPYNIITYPIILQNDNKIVVGGTNLNNFLLVRFLPDGSVDSTFVTNGVIIAEASLNGDGIQGIAISNNKLYAVGYGSYPGQLGVVARYLLDNNQTPPTVTLTAPANNATYLAPAAHIRFFAVAADKDGTISKVEFYNGTTLLHTETVFPYGFTWRNVQLGNYTLTAKAYDNSGNVTTSAPVYISVVPNKPPVVSITKPVNNRSFAAPGYIHLEAAASDTDGRVTNVKFYNGSSLLRTEYEYPYTYHWGNVPAGTYTITAVATDNWGAHTTSAPVTIVVTSANAMIVSNRSANGKTPVSGDISLKLYPNPATNAVNVYTQGLQQSKPATISIIGVSGIVLKTLQTNNSTTQLDVSSLAKGVYTIKIVSGDKVMYKQFVKL